MVFSTYHLIFLFLPLVLGAHYLANTRRLRMARAFVLALSFHEFHGWSRPGFIGSMLVSTVLDRFRGRITARKEHRRRRSSRSATSKSGASVFAVRPHQTDVARLPVPPVDHGMFR